MEPNQRPESRGAACLARLIGIRVLLLALLVLAGWVLDNPLLKSALTTR
jgi:hypothetical protein